ncbi:MAG: helix-turn-helix domain-containing protein [Candidatus Gastranaerophilales bacterium]|nr:helix-turn-helix domain-containing protein [Candidatus Gastranaerophilales bacterium]
MNIKKELGNRIKELRLKHSYTQETLSEKLDISPKSLSQIELGNNFVSAETLEKLCTALNVSPKALFDFEYSNYQKENAITEINIKLQNDSKLLKTIYKIITALDN